MSLANAIDQYADLVGKVYRGATARNENDLSANLAAMLQAIGLSTVIDTGVSSTGRNRSDIPGYVKADAADLADAIINSHVWGVEESSPRSVLPRRYRRGWCWWAAFDTHRGG